MQVPNVEKGTGLTSTSLDRAPAPPSNFVRGKTGNVPFWPGGLDEVLVPQGSGASSSLQGLRTIAPGLSRGLQVGGNDANGREDFVDSLDVDGDFDQTSAGEEVTHIHTAPLLIMNEKNHSLVIWVVESMVLLYLAQLRLTTYSQSP